MDFEVRRLDPDEWQEFRRLRLEALQAEPLAFVEQYAVSAAAPDEYWQDRVRRGATDPSTATFVALHGGRMIGKATGFVDAEVTQPTVHLVGVYVAPAYRGVDKGVSAAVVGAVMRWARDSAGTLRARLFVTEVNGRSSRW
jgi:GNAT superfamily N-acetyltransferase